MSSERVKIPESNYTQARTFLINNPTDKPSNYSSKTKYRIATKLSYDEDRLISYKGSALLVRVHVCNNNTHYICHRGSNGNSTNPTDIDYFHIACIRH
jgi:hypothetical protein